MFIITNPTQRINPFSLSFSLCFYIIDTFSKTNETAFLSLFELPRIFHHSLPYHFTCTHSFSYILFPILANLLATPNITAFVNSPLSNVHASAIAPPTTSIFGMFFPDDGFSSPGTSPVESLSFINSSTLTLVLI